VTDLRDKLTDAVTVAVNASRVTKHASVELVNAPAAPTAVEADAGASSVVESVTEALSPRKPARGTFAGYREIARRAWSPDVAITPAWVRQVTGCSRGLSSRLAATLKAELATGPDSGTGDGPGVGVRS
jgi:hypothetical protein